MEVFQTTVEWRNRNVSRTHTALRHAKKDISDWKFIFYGTQGVRIRLVGPDFTILDEVTSEGGEWIAAPHIVAARLKETERRAAANDAQEKF